jgi:chromosome segregation ATPase
MNSLLVAANEITNMAHGHGAKQRREMIRQQECAEKKQQKRLNHAKKVEEDQERKRRRLEEKSKEEEEKKSMKSVAEANLIETAVKGMEKVASEYLNKVVVERMCILADIRTESEQKLEDKCSDLQSQVDELRGKNSALKNEIRTLDALQTSSKTMERTLRKNLDDVIKANGELTLQLTTMAQKNADLNNTMATNEWHCKRYSMERTVAVEAQRAATLEKDCVEKKLKDLDLWAQQANQENALSGERCEMFNNFFFSILLYSLVFFHARSWSLRTFSCIQKLIKGTSLSTPRLFQGLNWEEYNEE